MTKRKTVITVETHNLTVVQTVSPPPRLWCSACSAATQRLTVEEAARVRRVTQRAVFLLAEDGRLHSDETASGQLLICAESLRS